MYVNDHPPPPIVKYIKPLAFITDNKVHIIKPSTAAFEDQINK